MYDGSLISIRFTYVHNRGKHYKNEQKYWKFLEVKRIFMISIKI